MEEVSRSFRAMNTDVLVIVGVPKTLLGEASSAIDEVERLFAANEAIMSRFRPESELSRLNRSAGTPFMASPLLFQVVKAAKDAAHRTNGIFDPTVLGALIEAGYDRSFELLEHKDTAVSTDWMARDAGNASNSRRASQWREVRIDEATRSITLPPGCAIDLGGIGKGRTVDQAATFLRPLANFAVDAGGDIYLAGRQGNGEPWTVGVADPSDPERDVAVLTATDRAVATSTIGKRTWIGTDGRRKHHLIDPRTGKPAQTDVGSATVVAETVTRAELLAKTALLLGSEDGQNLLNSEQGIEWMLVLADRTTRRSSGLPEVQYAG